ncbi:MAG: zinc ribbon domain-containing protein [Saccharofermentanales bacterium]|jgi:hypothetical protein
MKNCHNCGVGLDENALFCFQCGSKQEILEAQAAHHPQPQVQAPPPAPPYPYQQPPQPGMQQPPQPGAQQPPYAYYPPPQPKEPSALALDGKRYPGWLFKGLLGSSEPIHLLYAAIVPFLITLFATLGAASLMSWHAGGFFLLWFFNLIIMAAMPAVAWVFARLIAKKQEGLVALCVRFSSYMNVVLAVSFLTMLLGIAIPAGSFTMVLSYVVPILILAASLLVASQGQEEENRPLWPVFLAITGAFIFLLFVFNAILGVGMAWGTRSLLGGLFGV